MSNTELLVNIAYKPTLVKTETASATVEAGLAITYAGAPAAAGGIVAGIAEQDAASGEDFACVVLGEAPAIAGGTITIGAAIASNASGKLVVSTTAGHYIIGRALTAASANQPFKLAITHEGPLPS